MVSKQISSVQKIIKSEKAPVYDTLLSFAKRTSVFLSIPSETMFEYPCPFACYYFLKKIL